MSLPDVQKVTLIAERACEAVVARPEDPDAWERLLEALAPMESETSINHTPPYFRGLFRQACFVGGFVRSRIEDARSQTSKARAALAVGNAAEDLRRILSELNSYSPSRENP